MQVKHCAVGLLTALLFILGAVTSEAKSIPKEFTQCNLSDPKFDECLKGAIQSAFVAMKNGLPSYQLLPIDPLTVTHLRLEQGNNQPISVKIDLRDAKLSGLSTATVNSVKSDIKNRQFEMVVSCNELNLEGDYEMDGKFLLLPLKGKGKTKMLLSGIVADVLLKADPVTGPDGDIYWNVSVVKIKITKVTNFKVHFDNLFNGDKVLGESTNKVLNDNWEGFWAEIGPALQETFAEVFRATSNVLYSKFPEKNMFGP